MNALKLRVAHRVRTGTKFIWWRCGSTVAEHIYRDRFGINTKDIFRCPLALATGLRYGEAVRMMGLTHTQEVAYGFTIDPTEPDILMDDLTEGWWFAPLFVW